MNLGMISNYVKAKWSKGLKEKKVDVSTKDIRLLACFGNGDDISVCPGLRPSERRMGRFYCGECGCGDKMATWLNGDEKDYTKLDHPYLSCPRKMPGFSDYEPSVKDSEDPKEVRKKLIEVTLGKKVLSVAKLVKPEQPKEEPKEEPKKKGCSTCKQKADIRNEIIDKLKREENLEPDFKNPDYNTRFREIWFNDERVKKIILQEKEKKEKGDAGCPSCQRKKELREEVRKELEQTGLYGNELSRAVNEEVNKRLNKN